MARYAQANILLTNGKRIVKLAWVKHSGTNVYLGPAITAPSEWLIKNFHFSYHEKGHRNSPLPYIMAALAPLQKIRGHVALLTFWVRRDSIDREYFKEFEQDVSENCFVVDLRTVPESGVNIFVGLLEPHREDMLQSHNDFAVRQKMIMKNVSPWIVIS